MPNELLPFCDCGCGLRVAKPGNRFISGHQNRGRSNPRSSEACAAISKAKLGVPHTSPAQLAADEAKRGVPNPHTSPAQIAADERRCGVPHTPEHCAAISAGNLGRSPSPKTCAAISAAKLGVKHSPEHCDAISASKLGISHLSPAHIAADDVQRGGNDLCWHHYIYNHNDLSLNTIQMTRSDHTSLHNLLRKLGYIVPHINMEEIK